MCVDRLVCKFGILWVIDLNRYSSRALGTSTVCLLGDDDLAREYTPCTIVGADAAACAPRWNHDNGGGSLGSSAVSMLLIVS